LTLTGGSPAGGVYSGPGISNGAFIPSLAGLGTHAITYTYTDGYNCLDSVTSNITVNPKPIVSLGSFNPVCSNDAPFALSGGNPAGGSYSGPGVFGGLFYPNIAGAGTHTIKYDYTDSNSCHNSSMNSITVYPLPSVNLATFGPLCINSGSFTLTGGSPSGGTYSGTGVIAGSFDPLIAGSGTHTITYTYTNVYNCINTALQSITVYPLPVVTIGTFNPLCVNAGPLTLSGGSPSGGTYSGLYVTNGVFYPSLAGTGNHTITYSYIDTNNCDGMAIQTISVTSPPTVSLGTLNDVCSNASPFTLTGGSPSGGSYSGPGVSGGLFYPSIAGPGTHTITYLFSANGCFDIATAQIMVKQAPSVNIGALSPICINAGSYILTTGAPSGGIYSGTGVSGGIFYPSIAGVGSHSITYFYTDSNGCYNTATSNIVVNPLPSVTLGVFDTICTNSSSFLLTQGTPQGGNYTGPGVSNGIFYPSVAGSGTHIITYVYADANSCSSIAYQTIIVNSPPTVSLGPFSNLCMNTGSISLSGGSPSGGNYSGPGIDSNGVFNPSIAGVGQHIITYSFTDQNSCTNSDTTTINVLSSPQVFLNAFNDLCQDALPDTLEEGYPQGGIYSGPGVYGNIFYPSVAGVGTHLISYSYIDSNGCGDTAVNTITVNALPTANAGMNDSICSGTSILLTASGGHSYLWSTNDTASTIAVTPLSTTTYSVTTTDVNGCVSTNNASVTISILPSPIANAGPDTSICYGNNITLTASGGINYNWSNSDTTAGIIVSPLATTTYTVTVTDSNGCTGIDDVIVNVNSLPLVNTGPDTSICYGNNITLTASGGINYNWSNSDTTAGIIVSPLATTTYTVTVTDGNGCTGSDDITVIINPLPSANAGSDTAICIGNSATLIANGGNTYTWSNNTNNDSLTITPMTTTSYTVTVTDGNGCTDSDDVTVIVNPPPLANAGSDTAICIGNSTLLIASGGNFYAWSNSTNNDSLTVTPMTTASYTVTVTDGNGCTDSDDVTVTVLQLPNISLSNYKNSYCINDSPDTLIGLPSGGSYSIPFSTDSIFDPAIAGTGMHIIKYIYQDILTFCSDTVIDTVYVFPLPSADAGSDITACKNAAVNLIATGGISYYWSTGDSVNQINISPVLDTTMYFVTVTDVNGCRATDSVTINVTPLPVANAGNDTSICKGDTIVLHATGGINYQWNTSVYDTNSYLQVSPFDTTSYSVIVFNTYGCSDNDTVVVNVKELPFVFIGQDTTICANHSLLLDAGPGFDNYLWSDGTTTQTILIDSSGVGIGSVIYSVTVTQNYCEGEAQIMITFDPCQGISNEDQLVHINVYPNPSSGAFTVEIDNPHQDNIEIAFLNSIGQQLYNESIPALFSNKIIKDFKIENISTGMYLLRVNTSNKVWLKKVVIMNLY